MKDVQGVFMSDMRATCAVSQSNCKTNWLHFSIVLFLPFPLSLSLSPSLFDATLTSQTFPDLKDAVSIDRSLRMPDTFLVITPKHETESDVSRPTRSFFETHQLPDWAIV